MADPLVDPGSTVDDLMGWLEYLLNPNNLAFLEPSQRRFARTALRELVDSLYPLPGRSIDIFDRESIELSFWVLFQNAATNYYNKIKQGGDRGSGAGPTERAIEFRIDEAEEEAATLEYLRLAESTGRIAVRVT